MSDVAGFDVYKKSLELSNNIWNICIQWECFTRNTIGYHLIRACDSISANLAEVKGRYSIKDNMHFCCYSRGNLDETKNCLRKVKTRNLIENTQMTPINSEIIIIGKQLNEYVTSLKKRI